MSNIRSAADFSVWKLILILFVAVLMILNEFAMNKEAAELVAKTELSDTGYWGTKAASYALIGAVAFMVTWIPGEKWFTRRIAELLVGLSLLCSGYYWLHQSTEGHGGWYITVLGIVGGTIIVGILIGPGIAMLLERRSGN